MKFSLQSINLLEEPFVSFYLHKILKHLNVSKLGCDLSVIYLTLIEEPRVLSAVHRLCLTDKDSKKYCEFCHFSENVGKDRTVRQFKLQGTIILLRYFIHISVANCINLRLVTPVVYYEITNVQCVYLWD